MTKRSIETQKLIDAGVNFRRIVVSHTATFPRTRETIILTTASQSPLARSLLTAESIAYPSIAFESDKPAFVQSPRNIARFTRREVY